MVPPRIGEGKHPRTGGEGSEQVSRPPPSVAADTATSEFGRGSTRIALAAVAGAHGVKGELRLKLFTESADRLAQQSKVFIGGAERRLLSVRNAGKMAIARIHGVSDRSAAEGLRGVLIEVERDALPPLEQGEYYHADLIGLSCVDSNGERVGEVVAVENFGAGDLLEIDTGGGRRSLIPFKPGIADLADGRITLNREFLA